MRTQTTMKKKPWTNLGTSESRLPSLSRWRFVHRELAIMKWMASLATLFMVAAAGCKSTDLVPAPLSYRVPRMTVYLASPLGFAQSTSAFLHEELIPDIESAGATALNPWDIGSDAQKQIIETKKTDGLRSGRAHWTAVLDMLAAANDLAIKKADGMVAVLDGVDVD